MKRHRIKKRYAMFGLMEYRMQIPIFGRTIDVDFSGGQISGYGVIPATCETSDPVIQRLIENSSLYIAGRIVKY